MSNINVTSLDDVSLVTSAFKQVTKQTDEISAKSLVTLHLTELEVKTCLKNTFTLDVVVIIKVQSYVDAIKLLHKSIFCHFAS